MAINSVQQSQSEITQLLSCLFGLSPDFAGAETLPQILERENMDLIWLRDALNILGASYLCVAASQNT